MSGASESLNGGVIANTEKECQDYLSRLPVEVHILSGGRLPLVPMKVGWEELQREVGAGRHKSLLEGNQYKQDKKARPEHKLCSPSFLFSHQKGEENAWSQGQRSKHQEKKREEGMKGERKKKKKKPKSSFSLFEVLSYTHLILFYQRSLLANWSAPKLSLREDSSERVTER